MAAQGQNPIDAKSMIRMLDDAGIRRAVLLSNAFRYGKRVNVTASPVRGSTSLTSVARKRPGSSNIG